MSLHCNALAEAKVAFTLLTEELSVEQISRMRYPPLDDMLPGADLSALLKS